MAARNQQILAITIKRVELPDHLRDEGGPAGLMAGAHTGTVITVEVLVEENVIAPVRIVLEELVLTVERSSAVRAALE